ncbi:multiple epidermal growth factor-like domains protein 10 [Ptychodera flava]|uniref:multiple epidermal growth factor-like domains protein 10 n=1 Tax=Ptychodera flava TaxID=63121 RepID=UPI00396A5396
MKMFLITIALLVLTVFCGLSDAQPGRALPDSPHTCKWFQPPTGGGSWAYRCCDGYVQEDPMNISSPCVECADGFYGNTCDYPCICESNAKCNKTDGTCICQDRYYGKLCSKECPCKNGATCNWDGSMISCTCPPGYHGRLCDKQCKCHEHAVCDQYEGCKCEPGFYGDDCTGECACPENSECRRSDGKCICKPGFYGNDCTSRCECYNGARCGTEDPNSCECAEGWKGPQCTVCDTEFDFKSVYGIDLNYCQVKCSHCINGDKCMKRDKNCNCAAGWKGDKCDQKCPSGFHGYNCTNVCDCNKNETCNHVTGACSCPPGQRCPDDKPETCKCPETCTDKCIRDSTTGTCQCIATAKVCSGPSCDLASTGVTPKSSEVVSNNTNMIVTIVIVLVVLVVVLSIIAIVLYVRSRRNQPRRADYKYAKQDMEVEKLQENSNSNTNVC